MTDSRKLGDFITNPPVIILTDAAPEHGGEGPRPIEFYHDDFVADLKQEVVDHAYQLMEHTQNQYGISTEITEKSATLPNGFPAPLTQDSSNNNKTFTKEIAAHGNGQSAVSYFETMSDSGLLETKVKKGMTLGSLKKDWVKDILSDIHQNGGDAEFPQEVDQLLLRMNRNSRTKPFYDPNGTSSEEDSNASLFYPSGRTRYTGPGSWLEPAGDRSDAMTLQQVKNLATKVLLGASGELDNQERGDVFSLDRAKVAADFVPGLARIGQPVPYGRFRPGNIMADINPSFVRKTEFLDGEDDKMSHGSPWNPLIKFNSLNGASARAVTAILVLTVSGAMMALKNIVGSYANSANTARTPPVTKPTITMEVASGGEGIDSDGGSTNNEYHLQGNYLGSSHGTMRYNSGASQKRITDLSRRNLFGLTPTNNDYKLCVDAGVKMFFDLGDGPSGPLATFSNNFDDTLQPNSDYGFYITLLRSVLRDTGEIITTSISSASDGIGRRADPNITSGFYDTVESLEEFHNRHTNSRLIKFMNIMAQIGDRAIDMSLSDRTNGFIDSIPETRDSASVYNELDQSILHKKSRLSTKGGSLSWGASTIVSLHMLPESIDRAQEDIAGKNAIGGKISSYLNEKKGFVSSGSGRLPAHKVKHIESVLDSTYVPFYFHDLRTNEIISFHAFLTTVSDQHSPTYEEGTGFGRVGNVYNYKNTTRTISLTFNIVSTNPDDFDQMWYKINRLIMLAYPQYTEGRALTDPVSQNRFVQPFSQIISATPVIRVRVGDLIKSNYSEFDIARMFGAGGNNFGFSKENQIAYDERIQKTNNRINNINLRAADIRKRNDNEKFVVGDEIVLTQQILIDKKELEKVKSTSTTPADYAEVAPILNLYTEKGRRRGKGGGVRPDKDYDSFSAGRTFLVVAVSENGSMTLAPQTGVNSGMDGMHFRYSPTGKGRFFRLRDDFVERKALESVGPEPASEDGSFASGDTQQVIDFFSTEGANGNPIMRAFEATAGKGIAAVIGNISIEEILEFPWETEMNGSVAPQGITVSLTLNVINDINPGLAHDGFMIGAPYNIGSMMNKVKSTTIGGGDVTLDEPAIKSLIKKPAKQTYGGGGDS